MPHQLFARGCKRKQPTRQAALSSGLKGNPKLPCTESVQSTRPHKKAKKRRPARVKGQPPTGTVRRRDDNILRLPQVPSPPTTVPVPPQHPPSQQQQQQQHQQQSQQLQQVMRAVLPKTPGRTVSPGVQSGYGLFYTPGRRIFANGLATHTLPASPMTPVSSQQLVTDADRSSHMFDTLSPLTKVLYSPLQPRSWTRAPESPSPPAWGGEPLHLQIHQPPALPADNPQQHTPWGIYEPPPARAAPPQPQTRPQNRFVFSESVGILRPPEARPRPLLYSPPQPPAWESQH
jgi:hypothetical protein